MTLETKIEYCYSLNRVYIYALFGNVRVRTKYNESVPSRQLLP